MVEILPAENDIAIFGDGTSSKIMDGRPFGANKQGEPMTRLVLRPTEIFRKLNDIKPDELYRGMDLVFEVPTKYIIPLNPYSQSNSVFFITCDYRKRVTNLMRFFYCHNCGKAYPNVFDALREAEAAIQSKEIQIANLKEELKETSETLNLDLSEKATERIVDDLYKKLSKLLSGGRAEE